MTIKIAAVRFSQEVKFPFYGERRGLANQPDKGQAPQFDVSMTFDPSTGLLTITPTRPNCGLPPVLVPRESIMWMEPFLEPVQAPITALPAPSPAPTHSPAPSPRAKGKSSLANGITIDSDD